MKCMLCEQKKAKRFCPAKNGLICPQCCGEKRVIEIDCPESCDYLKAGREREALEIGRHIEKFPPHGRPRAQKVLKRYPEVLSRLEYRIGLERRRSRHLTDRNVAEALAILIDTYKTEENGILYEKTSDDLMVDSVRRELRNVIEQLRNPDRKENQGIIAPEQGRLTLDAAIECLEFVQDLATSYMEDNRPEFSYIGSLARLVPREERQSSILLP